MTIECEVESLAAVSRWQREAARILRDQGSTMRRCGPALEALGTPVAFLRRVRLSGCKAARLQEAWGELVGEARLAGSAVYP